LCGTMGRFRLGLLGLGGGSGGSKEKKTNSPEQIRDSLEKSWTLPAAAWKETLATNRESQADSDDNLQYRHTYTLLLATLLSDSQVSISLVIHGL